MNDPMIPCLVEGCEYEGSLAGVRSHISASSDPEHDWQELREGVETTWSEATDEGDEPDTDHDDPPETGDVEGSTEADDPGDEVARQWGGSGNKPREQPAPEADEPDDPAEGAPQSGDGEGSTEGSDPPQKGASGGASKGGSGGGLPLPVSTTTLVMGLALVAMAYLVLQMGAAQGGAEPATDVDDRDGEEEPDEGVPAAGEVNLLDG